MHCIFSLYYVRRNSGQTEQDLEITVKGNYSSKIIYIVRLILQLKQNLQSEAANCLTDSLLPATPKILIFSQWQPILAAIGQALQENGVSFRQNLQPKTIYEFKVCLPA